MIMQKFTITTEQQGTWTFEAERLASDTSYSPRHNHDTTFVLPGTDANGRKNKCAACRWHEVDIYRTDKGEYILHTVGASNVPGEIDFARLSRTDSPYTLIELATVRGTTAYLPATTARALATAAMKDDGIRDAYVNRAVV